MNTLPGLKKLRINFSLFAPVWETFVNSEQIYKLSHATFCERKRYIEICCAILTSSQHDNMKTFAFPDAFSYCFIRLIKKPDKNNNDNNMAELKRLL